MLCCAPQVADRVSVYTKSHEEDTQWVWTSTVGSHQYSIREDEDAANKMVRGTRVVLHLKVRRGWRWASTMNHKPWAQLYMAACVQERSVKALGGWRTGVLAVVCLLLRDGGGFQCCCPRSCVSSELELAGLVYCLPTSLCVVWCCRRMPRSWLTPSAWPA
jgi:hypothetical protein